MCAWGDNAVLMVPMDPAVVHHGQFRWEPRQVDRCLVPLLMALNALGKYTSNCCCGHGKDTGEILFHDGSRLELPCRPV